MQTCHWLLFVSHLPGKEGTARMRLWRGLRAAGASILRDGVYLLPETATARKVLDGHAAAVREAGGTAHVLLSRPLGDDADDGFRERFDRGPDYAAWREQAGSFVASLADVGEAEARRGEAALRRALDGISEVDFFPGGPRDAAFEAMDAVAGAVNARFSPDEPTPAADEVTVRDRHRYQRRVWATRARLWIDRVASAWLIRRFIDPGARFQWLASPSACPDDAVGFDFDGAEFSHAGPRVTFEVLLQAFDLASEPGLERMGAVIHYLDVGGAPVAEAPGVLALLSGARQRCHDDDAFLDAASGLLDDLLIGFTTPRSAQP